MTLSKGKNSILLYQLQNYTDGSEVSQNIGLSNM
jgi:hypothetical protein